VTGALAEGVKKGRESNTAVVKKGPVTWVNVYGASGQEGFVGKNKNLAAKMNENPSIATKWNGRVLYSVDSKDTEKPILKS
jgi:hypothetical protein